MAGIFSKVGVFGHLSNKVFVKSDAKRRCGGVREISQARARVAEFGRLTIEYVYNIFA